MNIFDAAPQALGDFFGPSCQMSSGEMSRLNAQQAQSAEQLARYASGQANSLVSLAGAQNAFRPTVRQLSDWECERLGLPLLPEDVQ
jgi:hypothetical protein